MDSDLTSIEAIKQGDESSLRKLMSRHKTAVFHFILRYTGNEADAEELTEETFVRVFFKADRFNPKATVKTWVFTIARNLCHDHHRKNKKRSVEHSIDASIHDNNNRSLKDSIIDSDRLANEKLEQSENLEAIQTAIHNLPDKLKFPLIFCVLEDNSYEDCAKVLGVSIKAVETRIYRARKSLKNL